jgi:heme exporter protein B
MTGVLLKKEWLLERRQQHAIAGILIYIISTVFVCFLLVEKVENPRIWSALLWITCLFTAFSTMQKTFQSESDGVMVYLHTLVSPRQLILSKTIYNSILVAVLNLFCLLLFAIFLGKEALKDANLTLLFSGILLGSAGLGATLTFIAGLSHKAGSNGLVPVLGFPVVIPNLITLVGSTTSALNGEGTGENSLHFVILVALLVASTLLSLVLFPYLWRD